MTNPDILLKIIAINGWLQHTDSILVLKRDGNAYDISIVTLSLEAYTTDGEELLLTSAEVETLYEMAGDHLAIRRLPDQRLLMAMPLLYGRARVGIGLKPPLQNVGVFENVF